MACIWDSASLDSSPKRMPTRALCFMNLVAHDWTHCGAERGEGQRQLEDEKRMKNGTSLVQSRGRLGYTTSFRVGRAAASLPRTQCLKRCCPLNHRK